MSEFPSSPVPRPVPRPPLHPPVSEEASNLERAFGFEELNFRTYVEGRSTHRLSARKLKALACEMDIDLHPLVMYGAGWAAAEAATHRRTDSSNMEGEHESRLNALRFAEACWSNARTQFTALEQRTSAAAKSADYWSFFARASFALASLPLFDVVTDWRTIEQFRGCDIQEIAEETASNVAELALDILNQPTPTREHKWAQSGVCNELLGCLLLQAAANGEGIVIPASLRQDHNRIFGLRADLLRVSTRDIHRKTLVQVSGHTHKDAGAEGVFMMRLRKLKLKGATNLETLAVAAREQLGESQPAAARDELVGIRERLSRYFSNFEEQAFNRASETSDQTKARPYKDAQEPIIQSD